MSWATAGSTPAQPGDPPWLGRGTMRRSVRPVISTARRARYSRCTSGPEPTPSGRANTAGCPSANRPQVALAAWTTASTSGLPKLPIRPAGSHPGSPYRRRRRSSPPSTPPRVCRVKPLRRMSGPVGRAASSSFPFPGHPGARPASSPRHPLPRGTDRCVHSPVLWGAAGSARPCFRPAQARSRGPSDRPPYCGTASRAAAAMAQMVLAATPSAAAERFDTGASVPDRGRTWGRRGCEVPVGGFPRCEVVRQVPPGDPYAVDIEDRVHDPPKVVPGRTADGQALPSPLGPPGRQHRSQQLPPGIGQVTRPLRRAVAVGACFGSTVGRHLQTGRKQGCAGAPWDQTGAKGPKRTDNRRQQPHLPQSSQTPQSPHSSQPSRPRANAIYGTKALWPRAHRVVVHTPTSGDPRRIARDPSFIDIAQSRIDVRTDPRAGGSLRQAVPERALVCGIRVDRVDPARFRTQRLHRRRVR